MDATPTIQEVIKMGSKVDRGIKAVATGGISEIDKSGVLKTGRSAAERAQKEQKVLIEKQRKADELELSEKESELAGQKLLTKGKKTGRRSLIKTSESGVKSNNLGGTI